MTAFAIRPAWTPATIMLTILGFLVFWPLGLGMLAYVIWGDRLKPELAEMRDRMRGFDTSRFRDFGGGARFASTGNSAFDDYRARVLKRLDEERRQLDVERREFETFVTTLRQARDKEEFDRFMAERTKGREGQAMAA